MVNVEGMFKAAQENPTVDSLLKTMETIVGAYKELKDTFDALERENERLRRQLNNNSQNSSMPSSTDQKSSKGYSSAS